MHMPAALDHLAAGLPAAAREPMHTLAEDGMRQLPAQLHEGWIKGAIDLAACNLAPAAVLAYLRLTPAVMRLGGAGLQAHVIATALSIAARADAASVETFFLALATASRRLVTTEALLNFLEV